MANDSVTCFDGASCDFRQEWLVGHVGQWINNGDLCFSVTEEFFELPRGIETCVASTDNKNLGHSNTSPARQSGVRASRLFRGASFHAEQQDEVFE